MALKRILIFTYISQRFIIALVRQAAWFQPVKLLVIFLLNNTENIIAVFGLKFWCMLWGSDNLYFFIKKSTIKKKFNT